MKRRRALLDAAMAALYVFSLGGRLVPPVAHEAGGLALLGLVGAHVYLNRGWFSRVFRGRYTARRLADTLVIALLAAAVALIVAGGLPNARALTFLHWAGGLGWRTLHTTAAYWGLVLAGLHLGFHWGAVKGALPRPGAAIWRALGPALAAAGLWASFDRQLGAKLFCGFGFDDWDPQRPTALFYLSFLGIMGLYAWLGQLWRARNTRK